MRRVDPPAEGDEKTMLVAFLRYLRETVIGKAEGLSDGRAGTPHPPSTLTLAALLKHLAYVEDSWVQETFRGQDLPDPWRSAPFDEDRDWELHSAAGDRLPDLVGLYRAVAARTDEVIAASSLDALAARPEADGTVVSLRWIVVHLVEETARHAGHADLIRESIDGTTGE